MNDETCLDDLVSDFDNNVTVDLADLAMLASCWFIEDTEPPVPDPAKWAYGGKPSLVLNEDGSMPEMVIVTMTAERAVDAWSGTDVEYQFVETIDADYSEDSANSGDWQASNTYTVSGLIANRTYKYVVRVRDENNNATVFSEVGKVWTGYDVYPPVIYDQDGNILTPDDDTTPRADFAYDIVLDPEQAEDAEEDVFVMEYTMTGPPYSSSQLGDAFPSISMTAERGTDLEGCIVEYRFERIDPVTGAILHFRDWLTEERGGLTWKDSGVEGNRLIPDTEYTYIVRMRDTSKNLNESAPSRPFAVIAELYVDDGDLTAPPVPEWLSSVTRYYCTSSGVELEECDVEGRWDVIEIEEVEDTGGVDDAGFEVEYQFMQDRDGEVFYSPWTTETTWEFEILSSYQVADYWVRARDTSQRQNTSDWSEKISR